jgi:multidrug efflux pump subunit AcrA (membrane-fusion protein)
MTNAIWVNARSARRLASAFAMVLIALQGCAKQSTDESGKAPLPVTVMTLTETTPPSSYAASGSVKSWKTEDIGFEVPGRVEWVLEPGKDIDGRIVDLGHPKQFVNKGTALAQIEPERYEIAVASAGANLKVAQRSRDGLAIRVTKSLPAQIESARANLKLAKDEFDRVKKLSLRNAASQSELEQADNLAKTRAAAFDAIEADKAQAAAELESAEAQIEQARQSLQDAERDLANTTLYGSYQGQISKVMVVPGSVVLAGSPVLTLQMTNPIKVEVELSSQQSRTIRRQRSLPVSFKLSNGTNRETTGFVYNIDASADPTTRTFTMTLLLLNEKVRDDPFEKTLDDGVARSKDVWPLQLNQMMGTPDDVILVEEASIRRDQKGAYVYMVTNAQMQEIFPPVLKVRRQGLIENDLRIPFLGNWTFRSVSFIDDQGESQSVSLNSLYVGELNDNGNPLTDWDGESVAPDSGSQWMLRPGDLVYVDLSASDAANGFYVPMEAIYRDSSRASLFVVRNGRAKKLPVQMVASDDLNEGSMIEVRSPELTEGMQVIVGGVHYLLDGQAVRIVIPRGADGGPIPDVPGGDLSANSLSPSPIVAAEAR